MGVRLAFFSLYKIDIWKLHVNQLVFGKEKKPKGEQVSHAHGEAGEAVGNLKNIPDESK